MEHQENLIEDILDLLNQNKNIKNKEFSYLIEDFYFDLINLLKKNKNLTSENILDDEEENEEEDEQTKKYNNIIEMLKKYKEVD